MGAAVSLLQAARAPSTVAGLALVSPVLPVSLRRAAHPLVIAQFLVYAVPGLGEWFLRARRERFGTRELVDRSVAFMTADVRRVPQHVVEQRYTLVERRAARPDSDRAFLSAARSLMRLLSDPFAYVDIIRDVEAPALMLHGAQDRLVSAESAEHLRRLRPDWSIDVLHDVGHLAQLETPTAVADRIERWLVAAQVQAQPRGGTA